MIKYSTHRNSLEFDDRFRVWLCKLADLPEGSSFSFESIVVRKESSRLIIWVRRIANKKGRRVRSRQQINAPAPVRPFPTPVHSRMNQIKKYKNGEKASKDHSTHPKHWYHANVKKQKVDQINQDEITLDNR